MRYNGPFPIEGHLIVAAGETIDMRRDYHVESLTLEKGAHIRLNGYRLISEGPFTVVAGHGCRGGGWIWGPGPCPHCTHKVG